jgi:hypothetical protein
MMAQPHQVAIIFEAEYGDKVADLAERMHVWVVDTPPNRSAAERLWQSNPEPRMDAGVTTFADSGASLDAQFDELITLVEDHHGWYAHQPPVTMIRCIGVPLTARVRESLSVYGYDSIVQQADCFIAIRPLEAARLD